MKKILVLLACVVLLATGCKGKVFSDLDWFTWVEITTQPESVMLALLDRQVVSYELDVSDKSVAILRVHFMDKMQINNRTIDVPWTFCMRMGENKQFKIVRGKSDVR